MITITNAILQAYQVVNKPIISMIAGTIVKVIFAYFLIGNERINIYGAPISTFFSVLTIVSINIYFIIKQSGKVASLYTLFIKPFIASAISIVLGIGIYMVLNEIVSGSIQILITIICVIMIFSITILKLKVITQEEITMLPKGEFILKTIQKMKLI